MCYIRMGGIGNMEAEQRKCKNEECQNVLPEGDQHKYCADCRKMRAERRMQTITDLLCAPGVVAMKIATRNNRHYDQEK